MVQTKKSKALVSNEKAFFKLRLKTWIETAKIQYENKSTTSSNQISSGANFAKVLVVRDVDFDVAAKLISRELSIKQIDFIKKSKLDFFEFHGNKGPIWVIRPANPKLVSKKPRALEMHRALIKPGDEVKLRDSFGQLVRSILNYSLNRIEIIFADASSEEMRQALLGLELGSYRFSQDYFEKEKKLPKIDLFDLRFRKVDRQSGSPLLQKSINAERLKLISKDAKAINLARHMVNLPPNILNPKSFVDEIENCFGGMPNLSVEVWKDEQLKKENMNLLRAVGQGAEHGPRLVHLKYRPKKRPDQAKVQHPKPIAFVGKGITFDSGGLDMKPSSAMRLMKKDMGGSAAVLSLCYWASATDYPYPLDFYLSIAENSVADKAFRPSDVIVARNSMSVEIHNTDAEGRLVLADALDVAIKQQAPNEPMMIINVATLTGAIKVGLGTDIAGLFCNHDLLSDMLFEAGREQNDLCWPMPLFQNYRNQLKSNFADMSNCSDAGFGGAISAALFLESFVGDLPWAHLDIYAWKDGVSGAFSESGGNGQSVLMLSHFLNQMRESFDRGEKLFD